MDHFLCEFWGNRSRDTDFEPKIEIQIGGLNRSSSKTNCRRRIKFSNLEVPGNRVSAPKFKL